MMASYTEQQQISDTAASGPGKVARLVDRLSKDITATHGRGVPMIPPKPGNNNSKTAHVRFSYVAQQDDELSLEEDDVIEFIEDVEDGWARGKLKDKVGLFPTNFVSFASAPTTNTNTYSSNLSRVNEEPRKKQAPKDESPPTSNGKTSTTDKPSTNESNVLPSSFKASVRKHGPNSNNGTSTTTTSNNNNVGASSTNKSTKEYAKVLYEYKAVNPDELDLKEGEIVTVINRKCSDEGWCMGELNGKRGLFPENFVRISSTNNTPPSTMSSGSTAPPILPAKPLKPVGFGANKAAMSESVTSTAPSTTTTNSTSTTSNAQTTTANQSNDSTTTTKTENTHKPLEERKSVVAGIQSKLFPQGKMPPYKPTFQPPPGSLSSSQHASARGENAPTVHMRHSVVDPTKMGLTTVHFDDQALSDACDNGDEPKPLESLTKFRPKQTNKRPPSTQFRASNVIKVETPPTTPPPVTPTTTNAPSTVTDSVAVLTGPATTSFPVDSRSSSQQASPNNNTTSTRAQEFQSAVKEFNSIASSVNSPNKSSTSSPSNVHNTMGQKSSRNPSSGSTHSNFYTPGPTNPVDTESNEPISKSEFNEFRAEVMRRLAKLEEKILKLDLTEPGDRQQNF